MPRYRCVTSNSQGKRTEIVREAPNEHDLIVTINETGLFLISYSIVADDENQKVRKRFSKSTILEFTEIMATLLKAGLTIHDSLEMCRSIAGNSKTSILSKGLLYGIVQGIPFHRTLRIYGSSFSPLYQSLVRLGEKTGSAASVFSRMSACLRSERKIGRKLANALWYPCLIVLAAVVGCVGIFFFIVPQMTYILSTFSLDEEILDIEITRIYRTISISAFVFLIVLSVLVFILIYRKISESFALRLDSFILFIPILGNFIRSIQTLDFSFAMEMLTGSGITIGSALKESSTVIRNRAYRAAILAVYDLLLKGEQLSMAFRKQKAFPPYICTWISVGERTGTVELVFSQIRDYFQGDVEHLSESMMTMIEPILTLLVGMVVLFFVMQFVLPIFSLYGRVL
jgi:type II secretory pathway component PulF